MKSPPRTATLVATLILGTLIAGCADRKLTSPLSHKVEEMEALYPQVEDYNSFIAVDFEMVKAQAHELDRAPIKGALYGMTLGVKDNIDVAGFATTAGTKAFASYSPEQSSPVVATLVAADALVVGKTNMHELAFGITSLNDSFGHVHNAIAFDYLAGGSSGGTAVAIALGLCDAGLGSDTGGSGRIPAAFNGLVGFRPTTGRYPQEGVALLSTTRDTISLMAKDVDTVIKLDSIIKPEEHAMQEAVVPLALEELRIGIPREYYYQDLSDNVRRNVERAIATLKAQGATLIETPIRGIAPLNQASSLSMVTYESSRLFAPQLKKYGATGATPATFLENVKSADVRAIFETAIIPGVIGDEVYQEAATNARPELQKIFQLYFDRNNLDVILIPVTPSETIPIAGNEKEFLLNDKPVDTFGTMIRNVDPASNAGIPAITIPFGKSPEGLPIGIELEAKRGNDLHLLRVAQIIFDALAQGKEQASATKDP